MAKPSIVAVMVLLTACAADSGATGSDAFVAAGSQAVYTVSEDGIVVYRVLAGDADAILTPGNMDRMDRAEVFGASWLRVAVPAFCTFDLASDTSVSFRAEMSMLHPYTDATVSVLLDFVSGQEGLVGFVDVDERDGDVLAVRYDLEYRGNYTLFPDIGPAYFELRASDDPFLAETAP